MSLITPNNPIVVSVKIAELRKQGYKSFEHWVSVPNHVYIARNMTCYIPGAKKSKWANPFKVGVDGTTDEVRRKYREYILQTPELFKALPELRGKILGCWCKPDFCHGDILVALLNEFYPINNNIVYI